MIAEDYVGEAQRKAAESLISSALVLQGMLVEKQEETNVLLRRILDKLEGGVLE